MTLRLMDYPWNDALQDSQWHVLNLAWTITGAKGVSKIGLLPVAHTFDAGLDTLAEITAILPNLTTDEFVAATAFGALAMGVDAFGFIVDMNGQARAVKYVVSHVAGTAASVPLIAAFAGQTTALTNALTNQATVSSLGNVAGHFVVTGLDALTSGMLLVDVYLEMK